MDRLWAIKQDVDPFRVRFVIFYSDLLALLRCSILRCPYCRWIFKVTWGPNNSLSGCGERTCWHCRQVFWDGSNEWPEMSGEEQRMFLLPITIMGYIGGFLLVPALLIWAVFCVNPKAHVDLTSHFLLFGPPLVAWFVFRGWQIRRSIRRYNERGTRVPS